MAQIFDYRLAWNPQTNTGSAELRFKGGAAPIKVPIDTQSEFLIVAHLLEKSSIAYDSATGWMMMQPMQPRPAGT